MVAIWHDGYRRNIVVVAWKHKHGLILQLLGVHLNSAAIQVELLLFHISSYRALF